MHTLALVRSIDRSFRSLVNGLVDCYAPQREREEDGGQLQEDGQARGV